MKLRIVLKVSLPCDEDFGETFDENWGSTAAGRALPALKRRSILLAKLLRAKNIGRGKAFVMPLRRK